MQNRKKITLIMLCLVSALAFTSCKAGKCNCPKFSIELPVVKLQ